MARRPPILEPICANCSYSLAGLPLEQLHCPECGQRYFPPDSTAANKPIAFRDPIIRAHAVCSINAAFCFAILFATFTGRHGRELYPKICAIHEAAAITTLLNLLLFVVLAIAFRRHTSILATVATFIWCIVVILVASTPEIR